MGNCQAIDTASLVIQHPNGKAERLYVPVSASEIMKANPGHYVALLISTTLCPPNKHNQKLQDSNNTATATSKDNNPTNTNPLRITRIKLLKPTDNLLLGQVYRLITTQEVMKGLWAKKQAKMKKNMSDSADWEKGKTGLEIMDNSARRSEAEDKQVMKGERQSQRGRTTSSSSAAASTNSSGSVTGTANNKSRTWQPSLLSISESAS